MHKYEDIIYGHGQHGKREPIVHYDLSEEHSLMRKLFDRLESVERFAAGVPRATSDYDNNYVHKADCYDMEGLGDLMNTLQYGLSSPGFINLVDLRLALPSAWHIALLAEALPQNTRDRLKHLGLTIVDSTGPSGDPHYTICDNEAEAPDGDLTEAHVSGYPPSNVQYAYPDRDHTDKLWSFITSCSNLETLGVEGTRYLRLQQRKWIPGPQSKGLQNIYLNRVWTDVDSILGLLKAPPTSESPSALRKFIMDDVKIYENGGNWETVFTHLRTHCPNLEFFHPDQLTYWSSHPRCRSNNRIWENSSRIWTYEDEDEIALEKVLRACVKKAGGVEYYPVRVEFEYTEDE
jgi:hypothetical protein